MSVTPKQREKEADAYKVQRFWPVVSGSVAVVLVAVFGFLIALRNYQVVPFDVDAEWMEELVEHRHPFWQAMALAFNNLGGGIFGVLIVPLAIIAILFLRRRRAAALYFAVASVVSALLVQIIKNTVD